jgi:hypothetical protein
MFAETLSVLFIFFLGCADGFVVGLFLGSEQLLG